MATGPRPASATELSGPQAVGTPNSAPTGIWINNPSVWEGYASNNVSQLAYSDPDDYQHVTFSIVSGLGDTDNAAFHIHEGSSLRLNQVADYETQNLYSIRLRVTDNGVPPLSFEKSFEIMVMDRDEAGLEVTDQPYFQGSNTDPDDRHGYSVAVWGDTMVVGAVYEDSSTTGINSTSNEGAANSGAVYIYRNSAGTWTQEAYIKASNTGADDRFGTSVAIWGDTLVVGAHLEDSGSSGVNSVPDENASNSGAAYVFTRTNGTWTQQAFLKAGNSQADDWFGHSVGIWGDTVVVGAPNESSSSKGVNSTPNENTWNAGAAYVFVRHMGGWTQQAYLKSSNPGHGHSFGISVAISEDTLVVGASRENSSTTGVNSTPTSGTLGAGAAYVYTRQEAEWSQEAYLKASHIGANHSFGASVAISGNTLVVGASGESSSSTGVNSTPDGNAVASGAAYVFRRNARSWTQEAYLKASTTHMHDEPDEFGTSVAISGDTVIVGAPAEGTGAEGVNQWPVWGSINQGAAYVFARGSGTWTQQAHLKPRHAASTYYFGYSVAVSGDGAVVGSLYDEDVTPYRLSAFPEISVHGNEVEIPHGDTDPSLSDHTDFGSAYREGVSLSRTFTIRNTGTATLTLGEVTFTGPHAADFSVSAPPPATIGPASNATFQITFDPSATGLRSATLNLVNGDADESPFVFSLQGTGVDPQIVVSGNGVNISRGDSTPSHTDHTDFGTAYTNGDPVNRTFQISNPGTSELNLGEITFTGPDADSFYVSDYPPASVSAGATASLTISFAPGYGGTYRATVHIETDVPGASPFSFALEGYAEAPEIAVYGNGMNIATGDTTPLGADNTDFGTATTGMGRVTQTFDVHNIANAYLSISDISLEGPQAGSFSITPLSDSNIGAGESRALRITFTPTFAGIHLARVTLSNNVPGNPYFSFAIRGLATTSAPVAQTITFSPPGTLPANHGPVLLSAHASSGLPVTLILVSGPATLEGSVLSPTGAGTVKITATQPGGSRFKPAPALTKSITIKATASVPTPVLVDLAHVYDGEPHAARVLNGTGEEVITYTVGKAATISPPVDAGTYPVKAVVNGRTLSGNLIIAKAPLRVVPDSHRRFIGQANAPLTVSYTGFVGGDHFSAFTLPGARRAALSTTARATSPGGEYPIKARDVVLKNYFPIYVDGTLLIETFAGMHEALLKDAAHLPVAKVAFTVAASSTTLSGKLTVPGETAPLPFTGTLRVDAGNEKATGASKAVVKSGKSYVVSFELPWKADFESKLHVNTTLTAQAADGQRLRTAPESQQSLLSGTHTLILDPALPAGQSVPAGSGHAIATIDAKAALKIAGKLADGTTLTASLLPDAHLGYRLFALPYARAGCYLAGWLDFEAHPHRVGRVYIPKSAGCDLIWAKDGRATDKSYRNDFGPVLTRVTVDPWIAPHSSDLLSTVLGVYGEFQVTHGGFSSASLSALPTVVEFYFDNNIVVSTLPANPTKWTTKVSKATGAFTGSFELVDAGSKRVAPFSGVLRQSHGTGGPVGAGHVLVPSAPGAPTNETISGIIRLDPLDFQE